MKKFIIFVVVALALAVGGFADQNPEGWPRSVFSNIAGSVFMYGYDGTTPYIPYVDSNGNFRVSSILSGEVEVTQPTHDDLNCNANAQWSDTDVSATNGLPVMLYTKNNIQLTAESISNPNLRSALYAGSQRADINSNGHLETQLFTDNNVSLTTESISNKNLRIALYNGTSIWQFDDTDKGAVSLYGKSVAAGDVPVLVDAAGNLQIDIVSATNNKLTFTVEANQTTHDDLNANANLQVGNSDVGNANPVPVSDAGSSLTVDNSTLAVVGGGLEATAIRVTVASDSTGLLSVDDNAGSLTIDNSTLAVVGGGLEATAMRVTIASDSTGVLSIDDNGSSITVDNSTLAVLGTGTEATAMRVTIATDSTGLISVDDNGGSITVDGSVTVSGTVTETNSAAILAGITSIDAVQGAKTDARSTATDATAITVMQVLKQISYMEQNPASRAVTGTFWQTTQPVSAAALPLPAGAATSALQLPDGHNVTVDNATGEAAVPIKDGGNSITVDGTFWQATQPISGTVAATQSGTWNIGSITTMPSTPVTGTFWQTTQPISAAALPLPSGAATSALQLADGHNVTIDNLTGEAAVPIKDGGNSITVDGIFWQTTQPVSIATMPSTPVTGTFWQTTQPVSAATLPLPSGAATSALQLADGHNVTVDNAGAASAVNIQDGGNTITVDGNVVVTNAGTFAVTETAPLTGFATSALQLADGHNVTIDNAGAASAVNIQDGGNTITVDGSVSLSASIPAGANNMGDVDVLTMPNVSIAVPTLYNLALTTANTEYSQAFTSAKSITFQNRSESDIRYAFVTGKVATPVLPYMTLKSGYVFAKENLNIASGTLYFAHGVGGITVEIEVW